MVNLKKLKLNTRGFKTIGSAITYLRFIKDVIEIEIERFRYHDVGEYEDEYEDDDEDDDDDFDISDIVNIGYDDDDDEDDDDEEDEDSDVDPMEDGEFDDPESGFFVSRVNGAGIKALQLLEEAENEIETNATDLGLDSSLGISLINEFEAIIDLEAGYINMLKTAYMVRNRNFVEQMLIQEPEYVAILTRFIDRFKESVPLAKFESIISLYVETIEDYMVPHCQALLSDENLPRIDELDQFYSDYPVYNEKEEEE